MTTVYARTREREKAWKFGLYCLCGSLVITPFWYLIFRKWIRGHPNTFLAVSDGTLLLHSVLMRSKVLWIFSEILESVCIIPQLLLLRQTTVPTVLDSYYLVALGAYRFLYILNWIVRGSKEKHYADPTSWVWGTIQTALMIDFAWVYYTRQRVKLRKGGVVDSDDLRQGWLVGRLVGRKSLDFDYDEEQAQGRGQRAASDNNWGRRGISVSADDGVMARVSNTKRMAPGSGPESQPLTDPAAFEDDSEEEETPPSTAQGSGVTGGDEWNDDVDEDAREHSGKPN